MQVILLKDVDKVGLRGDVVDVARGYARNYLLPRRLAERASSGRLAELRRHEERRARQEARTQDEARDIAMRLEQTVLRFDVKAGPTGSLFGSVTATDVADRLWADQRIRVDRRKIELDPIKRVGRYETPVEVFADVSAAVQLEVVPEGGDIAEMEALQAAAEAEEAAAVAEAEEAAEAAAAAEAEAVELVEAAEAAEAAAAAAPEGAVEAEAAAAAAPAKDGEPVGAETEPNE